MRTRTPSAPPRLQQIGRGRSRGHSLQLPLLPQLAPLKSFAEAEDGRGRSSSESSEEERPLPHHAGPRPEEEVGPDPAQEWLDEGVRPEEEVGPDPPQEWLDEGVRPQEEGPRQIRTRPTREAGEGRPGCWNYGEIGHSRIDCSRPRERVCYMCGRPNITIATCPTCCQAWGQRPNRSGISIVSFVV